MKQKHNGGFSLIETVVAIAILGLITVPSCSALLMSIRINEKAQQVMQAQLAVSSAVETLMAEGIDQTIVDDPDFTALFPDDQGYDASKSPYDFYTLHEDGSIVSKSADRFSEVVISVKRENADDTYYTVVVRDNENLVEVTTVIREKEVVDS